MITLLVFFYLTIKTPARDSSVMDVLHTFVRQIIKERKKATSEEYFSLQIDVTHVGMIELRADPACEVFLFTVQQAGWCCSTRLATP